MLKRILPAIALFAIEPSVLAKNFVLISAPGSGKGTFSQYLIEKHGYVQVCPGDIFRGEINAQTELGKKIQPIVEKGEYVEESIVCQLISDNLSKIIAQNKPFIIDGFPRSDVSFEFLHSFFLNNKLSDTVCFLQFVASDDVCIERIVDRLVCNQCYRVYNSKSVHPTSIGKCDFCDASLAVRKADTRDTARTRLDYFHANVEPLMELAAGLYLARKVDTERPLKELHKKYDQLTQG